jgi:hypothetical protein
LIENEDRVSAGGYSCSDLVEMKLHGFGVAERENEGSAGPTFGGRPHRTDRSIGCADHEWPWDASPSWPSDR